MTGMTHEQLNSMTSELTHKQLNDIARRIKYPDFNPLCSTETLQRLVQDACQLADWVSSHPDPRYAMRVEHFDVVSKYPTEQQIEFLRWSVENQTNSAELRAYARAMSGEDLVQ